MKLSSWLQKSLNGKNLKECFFEVGIFCVPFKNEFAWAGGEGGGGGGGGEVR